MTIRKRYDLSLFNIELLTCKDLEEMGHKFDDTDSLIINCLNCKWEFFEASMTIKVDQESIAIIKYFKNNSGYEGKIPRCSEVIMRKALE